MNQTIRYPSIQELHRLAAHVAIAFMPIAKGDRLSSG